MEYNKLIAEMHTGDDVEGFYVLKDAFLKTTAAGKPFYPACWPTAPARST